MNQLLILPIVIPLATAIGLQVLRGYPRMQGPLGVFGAAALLAAGLTMLAVVARQTPGHLVLEVGNWPAPFGIVLVADLFSAIMVAVTGFIGFVVAIYAGATIDSGREAYGFFALFQILLMGVSGAFLTGDIFNLYVWFEVMLIASFVLLALGGERGQLEGAVKYVTLNLVASAFFLAGVGVLYSLAGTLNMADLARRLPQAEPYLVEASSMLFLVAFGIKAAVFPLFFWLPASYHTPPVAVSAVFAGLLTKVGVYALIRVFTLIFRTDAIDVHLLILIISGLTMVTGVLGAAAQNEIRRILSFHIISQIGYMLLGLGLFSPLAIAGSVFYIVHHIIVKTNLFLISGVIHRISGSYHLDQLGGLYAPRPLLAVLFVIPAFSLAGVPPLSGFWAKLILVEAGLKLHQYAIVAVALVVSILTLYSMTKIWAAAFWKDAPSAAPNPSGLTVWMLLPIVVLAGCTVAIGLYPKPLLEISLRTAEQLLHPELYIAAVLGEE